MADEMAKQGSTNIADSTLAFDEACSFIRKQLKHYASQVLNMKKHSVFKGEALKGQDHGEMIANLMLAYPHLEDATMRMGKAIQAFDGGVSVYDK